MIPAPKNVLSFDTISLDHSLFAKRHPLTMIHRAKQHLFICLDLKIKIDANYSYSIPFLLRQRLFVPNIFLKSRQITLGTCAKRMES